MRLADVRQPVLVARATVVLVRHDADVAVRNPDPLQLDDRMLGVGECIEETGDYLAHGSPFTGAAGSKQNVVWGSERPHSAATSPL
jgi:hypothetical protein